MFLRSSAVPDFVALHEGSIVGEKTQPTLELFPEEKYPWFGEVTGKCNSCEVWDFFLIDMSSCQQGDIAIALGSARLSWRDISAGTSFSIDLS
jgi:hypothetical protein